jgi:hypothetical protein
MLCIYHRTRLVLRLAQRIDRPYRPSSVVLGYTVRIDRPSRPPVSTVRLDQRIDHMPSQATVLRTLGHSWPATYRWGCNALLGVCGLRVGVVYVS